MIELTSQDIGRDIKKRILRLLVICSTKCLTFKTSPLSHGDATVILSISCNFLLTKRSKICALKMLLGDPPDVLVLSTFKSRNNPMLVNIQGKSRLSRRFVLHAFMSACLSRDSIWIVPIFQNYSGLVDGNLKFDYGTDVSLKYGCGLTLRGQMWYFGGSYAYKRQVSSKAV